jgi:hypothetical protein
MKQFGYLFLCTLGFFLSSCTIHRLSVQTHSISHTNLASYHVGTPDPHLDLPLVGQSLLIEWRLKEADISNQFVELYVQVRFRNQQQDQIVFPIKKKTGTYLYQIRNLKYNETKGILAYKVFIRSEERILASWQHPLWTAPISLNN